MNTILLIIVIIALISVAIGIKNNKNINPKMNEQLPNEQPTNEQISNEQAQKEDIEKIISLLENIEIETTIIIILLLIPIAISVIIFIAKEAQIINIIRTLDKVFSYLNTP